MYKTYAGVETTCSSSNAVVREHEGNKSSASNNLFNVENVGEVFAQSSEPGAHVKNARQQMNRI